MTAGVAAPTRSTGRGFVLVAFVAFVLALAMAGAVVAILALAAGHDEDAHSGVALGQPIATSFGTVTVSSSETLGGLTSGDLGGVTHGIQNLVLSDKAQVEVFVAFTNTSGSSVLVEPAQFRLLVQGTADPVVPTGSTMEPLRLKSGASVEAGITFVVPQSGAPMTVAYQDPGASADAAITVPIGVLGQAPAADPGHTH